MRLVLASFVKDSPDSGMGKWVHRVAEESRHSGHTVEAWFAEDFSFLASAGTFGRNLFPLALAERLIRRRREIDVAVVHEPAGFDYGILHRYAPALPPLVVVTHGVESRVFDEMVAAQEKRLAFLPLRSRLKHHLIRRWQSNGSLRLADRVVCLSAVDRDYLRLTLGISSERILVAINGSDPLPAVASHSSLRVVVIGSWIEEKGSLALPIIWKGVRQRVPQARLTILGTGRGENDVCSGFDREIQNSVEVIPKYSGAEELITHARGASVFLLPSLREGSPLALLEAMSLGLAPVASSVGGVPEILTGDLRAVQYGRFDLDTAIRLVTGLLLDPVRAARVAALARSRAAELPWKQTARVVENACAHAFAERDRPVPKKKRG